MDDMIPRITVRDAVDAEFLICAIRTEMEMRIAAYSAQARKPQADQYQLSHLMIADTTTACELIDAIGNGIVADTTSSNTTEGE